MVEMVERLKARAREEGLDVEAHVMDGHALDLENDTLEGMVGGPRRLTPRRDRVSA